MMREMRPVFSRPIFCQFFPASVDLKTPQPTEMCERMNGSPVPAQTTFGSFGATASEPIELTGCPSKIGFQVMPSSVVFQMPPDAAPA